MWGKIPYMIRMKGGAREAVIDIIMKQWSPIEVYIVMFLILSIVFVREYPIEVRRNVDTLLGKTALFAIAIAVAVKYSWVSGIFIAIFTLLVLSMSPRRNEGFQTAPKTTVKMVPDKNLWWVEAVLKENPIGLEETEVQTSAIQDGATTSRSTGNGGP
jgi:hypothetical protein